MNAVYTRETWLEAYRELLQACEACALPRDAGKLLAKNLRTEKSIRRMVSYLHQAHPRKMEDVADEMVAILEERQRWIEKKQAEESNAFYNAWLNSDLREDSHEL